MSSLSLAQIQTFLLSLVTWGVTQLVAFVPSLGPDKQNLISGGGTVIAAGILIAGAIHHIAEKKFSLKSVEATLRKQIIDSGRTPVV